MQDQEYLFTASGLLDMLLQIDEFKYYQLDISSDGLGNLQLHVNDSIYMFKAVDSVNIPVSDTQFEAVQDCAESTYEAILDDIDYDSSDLQSVNSGLLKQLVKTLLVGGMVRITNKLLK